MTRNDERARALPSVSGLERLEAARLYAQYGFYLVPVAPKTKNPGSVLGEDWPTKSSRDPEQIREWFLHGNHDIALHVGRSGVVVFDIDDPEQVPPPLLDYLEEGPFQATRRGDDRRGHLLFRMPPDVVLGNGKGSLTGDWGDVRGENGVIIVEPSQHDHAEGHYHWLATGVVGELPTPLLRALLTRPEPATARAAVAYGGGSSSVARRIRGVLRAVEGAPEGNRNSMLFWASSEFGVLAARGAVSLRDAHGWLINAGLTAGLSAREVPSTVKSGLRAGWVRARGQR